MTRQQINHYVETEQWDFLALMSFVYHKVGMKMTQDDYEDELYRQPGDPR